MNLVKRITVDSNYGKFLREIKEKIVSARINAVRNINKELIDLYWGIGEAIIERQKLYKWGQSIVEKLSIDLQREFPNIQGFSSRNLWDMKRFYEAYKDSPILRQLVAEIPWGHHLVILNKTSDIEERQYYIKASSEMGWSRNVLLNQINADAYKMQKIIPKQHNFSKVLPVHLMEQAEESIKSVYNLDFLGITRPVLERELEKRLVEKVKHFILELGYGFSFIGNQYKLTLQDNEYYIDLLFFNRRLKCLIAIELLCGAPHNKSSVALPIMWRSVVTNELYHNMSNNSDKTEHHIINRFREPVRNSVDLDHLSGEPSFLFDEFRRGQELSLSSQDRFRHKCWLC